MLNRMQKMLRNRSGFTLIELIVVIAILAILVGIAVPRFRGFTKDADIAAMQADAKTLSNGSLQYAIKNNDDLPVVDTDEVTEGIQNDGAVPTNAELLAVLAVAKESQGIGEATEIKVAKLDQAKIGSFYKTLKNELEEYVIVVTEGALEGEVFYDGALEGSDGSVNSGIYTVPAAAEVVEP